ncbi:SGNH/GDSL hydrolase family protein [Nocardiopsis deserti]|uniref:SGNH/GDSL hydrolase family protein n=1 Tax=Nocardiopsis deserti TaxID=2605988 RepID=UPI00123A8D6E|nr:SGNH/GDSL hydrolase family protein [Nocardiopsis deserti]
MITRHRPLLALTGLLVLPVAACSAPSAGTDASERPDTADASAAAPDASAPELSTVLLLGDSIAQGQAQPLEAAFEAGGVDFRSLASAGGGNVVGPTSEEQWKTLPDQIASAEPDAVIYQITTYDWGGEHEQRDAYERLLTTVTEADATLVFVTMPPIRPDDFYEPHMEELDRAPDVAREVVEDAPEHAALLDAGEVWGETYQREREGAVDRSSDGIHTCPQGAARFTSWLLAELTTLYPDFSPPAADEWANTGWSASEQFTGC